jgi:4-amino-4-deoxychorismate lyase
MVYWFDGQLQTGSQICLELDDPALFYGATVFTTLRVYGQSLDHPLTAWTHHQRRLSLALEKFGWPEPNWSRLRRGAEQLQLEFTVLRITCWPDGRELIAGRVLPPDLEQRQHQGVTAWVARGETYRRSQPAYKTGNYLGSWLAQRAAQGQGASEAILVNPHGHWLETSTGNLWGWRQGQWYSPCLADELLPGVSRQQLINHLEWQGLRVSAEPWREDLVRQFTVLAYGNCVVQVVPIHTVWADGGKLEFDAGHSSLQQLRTAFAEPG